MNKIKTDWRLQGQENYLMEEELQFKQYKERATKTDHDHCEFCNIKFTDNHSGTLHEGFTTKYDNRWICRSCYSDFNELFKFKVLK